MIESDLLRKRLRERMNTKADHIAGGGCADWAEYRKESGVIEGLAMAERDLLDMVDEKRKQEEGDDE